MPNNITSLWYSEDESAWKKSLADYYSALTPAEAEIDARMENLDIEEIRNQPVEEFYTFLHDGYFVWKYTAPNRLATTRRQLERYISENRLDKLENIKNQIFALNRNDIRACLENTEQIMGLGTAGASGLLAILFPEDFGTVDQFVAIALQRIQNIDERVKSINPEHLRTGDGVIIIEILRNKASELNELFHTNFWTPRKIDMILWVIDRER